MKRCLGNVRGAGDRIVSSAHDRVPGEFARLSRAGARYTSGHDARAGRHTPAWSSPASGWNSPKRRILPIASFAPAVMKVWRWHWANLSLTSAFGR